MVPGESDNRRIRAFAASCRIMLTGMSKNPGANVGIALSDFVEV
jgi:hypothetical protein